MKKLYFIYGAMASGKSAALLQMAYNYKQKNKNIILIKPSKDTKGGPKIISRTGLQRTVDIMLDEHELLKEYLSKEEIRNLDCIIVDEAQFLSRKQVDELFGITKIDEVPVICYGLKTDFKSNAFPGSARLFELADELEELKTICECGEKSGFNARKINGRYVLDGEQVIIDGVDNITYESLCGSCYAAKVLKLTK